MRLLRSFIFFISISATLLFAQSAPQPQQKKSPAKSATQAQTTTDKDTHLSPAEADELFKSMDDIMKFSSDDSGLPIHSQIKRELNTRDQVVQYIQQKMEEGPDTKRFERTEIVLKKFGL